MLRLNYSKCTKNNYCKKLSSIISVIDICSNPLSHKEVLDVITAFSMTGDL